MMEEKTNMIQENKDNDNKYKKKKNNTDVEVLEEWNDNVPEDKVQYFTE